MPTVRDISILQHSLTSFTMHITSSFLPCTPYSFLLIFPGCTIHTFALKRYYSSLCSNRHKNIYSSVQQRKSEIREVVFLSFSGKWRGHLKISCELWRYLAGRCARNLVGIPFEPPCVYLNHDAKFGELVARSTTSINSGVDGLAAIV